MKDLCCLVVLMPRDTCKKDCNKVNYCPHRGDFGVKGPAAEAASTQGIPLTLTSYAIMTCNQSVDPALHGVARRTDHVLPLKVLLQQLHARLQAQRVVACRQCIRRAAPLLRQPGKNTSRSSDYALGRFGLTQAILGSQQGRASGEICSSKLTEPRRDSMSKR